MGIRQCRGHSDAQPVAFRVLRQLPESSARLNVTGPGDALQRESRERVRSPLRDRTVLTGTEDPQALLPLPRNPRVCSDSHRQPEELMDWIAA